MSCCTHKMFFFSIIENETVNIAQFSQFSHSEGLPFPINQNSSDKNAIIVGLVLDLLFGVIIRFKIIEYLKTVDISKNAINYFFWLDQVNGAVLGLYVLFTLMALSIPFPLSDFLGDNMCNWADLLGCIYLSGSTIWSLNIALYRILLLKAPSQLEQQMIKGVIPFAMTVWGITSMVIPSAFVAYTDKGFG